MRLRSKQNKSGSVLVMTIVLAAILGITLSGYLFWARTQNVLVAQSQAWNAALAMAEAGIEEGMAQVNVTFGTNYHSSASTNWGWAGGIYGPRNNSLAGGSYSATIIPGTPGPTIISTGYARMPLMSRAVQRIVRVTTTSSSAFGNAMVALGDITFNGNDIEVDSYDSADALHSTNGLYYAPWRKAGGDVATTYGTLSINNANIKGMVKTGAEGKFEVGPRGYAGDLYFTGPGIQEGWYANDFNVDIKEVDPPDHLSDFIEPTAISGDTNKYVLGSGGYIVNGDLTINGDTILVNGNAVLYVAGNLTMQGGSGKTSAINIAPGARLQLYVAGPSAVITTVNTTGNAGTFSYYGLPSNISITWSGNSTFVGVVYAPQATFTCGGGGATIYDYQGACVVKDVSMNGHFRFHYDENLKRMGMPTGYVVTSWKEL